MLPIAFSPNDVATATNADVVLTYAAAGAGVSHVLWGFAWAYSSTPTGGAIKIEDGAGNVVFGPHRVTSGGPGSIVFLQPQQGTPNTDLIITLLAGGNFAAQVTGIGHFATVGPPLNPFGLLDFSQGVNSQYLFLLGF